MGVPPVTIDDIADAAGRIAGQAARTPLIGCPLLDDRVGGRILFKCENLQRTGSFKFRGAYNTLAAMPQDLRRRGVVAVSSGNHAQGVAEAARLFGVPATIVMPVDAPATKRRRTVRSGARIVDYDRVNEDRDKVAAQFIMRNGGTLVHPYNDPQVIAGQGTIGAEIISACTTLGLEPDAILIPCGGGGLSAGIGVAFREGMSDVAVSIVEPAGFDDYGRSLALGEIVTNSSLAGSICDALLAPSPGAIGFALNKGNLTGALTVTDDEALDAVAFAFREMRLVVEPGGAVGMAAVLAGHFDCQDRVVIVVLSGGNIDDSVLRTALERGN
jgi:threonine dehydratase